MLKSDGTHYGDISMYLNPLSLRWILNEGTGIPLERQNAIHQSLKDTLLFLLKPLKMPFNDSFQFTPVVKLICELQLMHL